MPKVPRITGEEAVRAFGRAGFAVDRVRGAHHILRHPDKTVRLSIPVHKGETVGIGLLRSQIKDAGLTVEQFIDLT
ncbi:MAG: type II toxin-antitoxin system HicA family toxin [Planctomycetota bacterium]|nr:type II toxin-antitoxin system HicA family toxin [Planctomycetota bacterium]